MKAVVFTGTGRVAVEDVPAPVVIEEDDALVSVTHSAICGSDIHAVSGKSLELEAGDILGHEFVGTVVDMGERVRGHREGARVLGSFLIACGDCPACGSGRYNNCPNRRALGLGGTVGGLAGAQAELVRMPHADLNLLSLEEAHGSLTDEQALFGGDILATGFHAAEISQISPGETVVVIGAGPVGLLVAAACRLRGPRDLLLLDTNPDRAHFARESLGLNAIDVSGEEPWRAVAARTAGAMADVAIDAVGAVVAFKSALRCVREGGRVTVVGVYGSERYEAPMGRLWASGVTIRFSGMSNVHAHWEDALGAVERGEIDPTALITHRLPLGSAEEGYELFASGKATKVVLAP